MRWLMTIAADDWIETKKASPIPGRPYLVASRQVGTVMDVAFFEGPRPSGGLWWIMSNAEFPSSAVTHWAPLNEP
jgi:hypothetical protein